MAATAEADGSQRARLSFLPPELTRLSFPLLHKLDTSYRTPWQSPAAYAMLTRDLMLSRNDGVSGVSLD